MRIAESSIGTNSLLDRVDFSPAAKAVEMHYADLSRPSEIRRLADALLDRAPRIDVMVNNAGAIFAKREITPDGLELTFALTRARRRRGQVLATVQIDQIEMRKLAGLGTSISRLSRLA